MTLLFVSSTVIAAACIGMGLCVLNGRRLERQHTEREMLITRLLRYSPRDDLDLLRHSPAGR